MRSYLCSLVVLFLVTVVATAGAQVIVTDDFESYASDAAFDAAWAPSNPAAAGLLVPRVNPPFPPAPFDGTGDAGTTPPVDPVVGQAVAFNDLAGINQWTSPFSTQPTATDAVRYSADIFDFVNGNRRFGLGLRNSGAANIFELGYYNADTYDPTDPINIDPMTRVFDQPTTGYAYRIINIDSVSGDLALSPNWQYFPLDIAFDSTDVDHNNDGRFGNGDGLVNAVDVGPGWHTFSATIETDHVKLELDLFRDGSIDSTVEWDLNIVNAPFNDLRMGGPSAISMNEFTMIDNVLVEMVPIGTTVDGDFNDDTLFDCTDVNSLTAEMAAGTNNAAFDLTGDMVVNGDDLDAWLVEAGAENPGATGGNPFLEADANLDGDVNGQDFVIWNNNKFTTNDAYCDGDFNGDGFINGQDFVIWNNNKFMSADSHVAGVPEPVYAGWFLALIALVLRRASFRN